MSFYSLCYVFINEKKKLKVGDFWTEFGPGRSSTRASAERFLVVGLFGNIRSMTPLLVVSACVKFTPEGWKKWHLVTINCFGHLSVSFHKNTVI